jgi:hypothetical protein
MSTRAVNASNGSSEKHALHQAVADIAHAALARSGGGSVLVTDPACGGKQRIPLFCGLEKGRPFGYCMVDLVILQNGAIRVLFEIEESKVLPTQVCGKLLTAALSKCLIHNNQGGKPVLMGSQVAFVQVLNTSRLKPKTSKPKQWRNLEQSLRGLLPLQAITTYNIFYGDTAGFRDLAAGPGADLLQHLVTILHQPDPTEGATP